MYATRRTRARQERRESPDSAMGWLRRQPVWQRNSDYDSDDEREERELALRDVVLARAVDEECERMWPICKDDLRICKDDLRNCRNNLEQNEQDLNLCRDDLRTAEAELIEQRKELEQKAEEVAKLSAELEKRPELKKRDPSPRSTAKRPPWK